MKSIIPLAIFSLLCMVTHSQSLQNTTWQTYNPSLLDTVTVEVKIDTIHQYIDPDSILVSSLFAEMNDTISLIDVGGPFACAITDTGWYSYVISNDTLTITLLTDPCLTRSITYNGVVLWRVDKPSGIPQSSDPLIEVNVFPNPSSGISYFSSNTIGELSVYSTSGQLIEQFVPINGKDLYKLELSKGSYVISFITDKSVITRKLLVY